MRYSSQPRQFFERDTSIRDGQKDNFLTARREAAREHVNDAFDPTIVNWRNWQFGVDCQGDAQKATSLLIKASDRGRPSPLRPATLCARSGLGGACR